MIDDLGYEIQGEGKTVGVPCYFVDLDKVKGTFEEIKDWLSDLNFYDNIKKSAHLVIRGDYNFKYDTKGLIIHLKGNLKHLVVEVETNGENIPPKELVYDVDYWNVMPTKFNSKSLLWYRNNPKAIFKFEIEDENHWDDINSKYIIPLNINHRKVFIMPKGDRVEYLDNHKIVTSIALANGVRFSSRLQKINTSFFTE